MFDIKPYIIPNCNTTWTVNDPMKFCESNQLPKLLSSDMKTAIECLEYAHEALFRGLNSTTPLALLDAVRSIETFTEAAKTALKDNNETT